MRNTKNGAFLRTSSRLAIAIGAAATLPVGIAVAQEDDEIIITATRRDATVQDVPLNIAAIGEAQISEQGFDEIADILAFVPGINFVDRGGRQGNPIIVRGINATPLGSGDGNNDGGGTVATYLGDIPVFVDLKLNDLERVEVLLGPQGTLYGAGTLGGAIRYIPNKPDFEKDALSLRGELYQYSEAGELSSSYGLTFNKFISDTFAIRGSIDFLDDSGFIDQPFLVQQVGVSNPDPNFNNAADVAANLRTAEDVDSEETLSGRLAARWAPNDWLDGTLTYYYQKADIGGRTINSFRSTVPAERYESGTRVPEPNEIENELLALEVTADLGFAELTSATGISKYSDDGQRDQTDLLITLEYSYELFPSFTSFTREVGEEERFNQEVRLVSTTDSRLNWIVGAFYNKFESAGSSSEFVPNYVPFVNAPPLNFGLTDRPDALEYFSTARTELEEMALFGEVGFDITDRWTVTVGGRYYDYELQAASTVDFPLFEPLTFTPLSLSEVANQAFDPDLAQSDDGFLFKFNTSYELNDDVLIYGTISEGYRIGGSNGLGECPAFDPNATQGACALAPGQVFNAAGEVSLRDERQFDPDTTTNYELGIKSTLMDGDLILNGAVYFVEWSDPQVDSATVNANIPITVNGDGAESKGVEVSADWRATDRWRVRGSFSHVTSELSEPVLNLVRTITPPGFGSTFEDGLEGDRLPGSPENQFSVFSSYNTPLDNGNDLIFNFGYAYQSDVLSRAGNRGNGYVLDGFGIANASLIYDAGNWSATLFADNLFDEYAETGVTGTQLFNQQVPDFNGDDVNVRTFRLNVAPPRAIGIRFNYDFQRD